MTLPRTHKPDALDRVTVAARLGWIRHGELVMGTLTINGIQVGDDGRGGAPVQLEPRHLEPQRDAMADALVACDRIGRRAARILKNNACRRYLRQPAYLNAIAWGLADAHPQIIRQRVEAEARKLSPYARDIVPVLPANLRGARLYALVMIRRDRAARRSFLQAAE